MRDKIISIIENSKITYGANARDIADKIIIALTEENRMVKQFKKQFELFESKGWNRIYVAVDIYETTMNPTWSKEMSSEFYEHCREVLRMLSDDPKICLILWSCSLPDLNKVYHKMFLDEGINFDYINENPECKSTDYADFESKLYFSIGLDDKFGFDPHTDWFFIRKYLNSVYGNG